jgi:hypothetical protein
MQVKVIDISPSSVRASLRAIASGKKPRLAPELIANLLLDGVLEDAPAPTPSDDFVRFAKGLYALEDVRGSL